ncbi:MAG: type II toxin-antitoxin system RelE/ParE family toxin [Candidatus Rokubacteria bacterium]|nr:type II toxin-antitoxin system RelE/ParE family toxin [Candidatus Rokubacteria bacterium]
MKRRLVVRPEAHTELLDARAWYEGQRPGLGTEFVAAVDSVFAALLDHPLACPRVHGDIRRAVVPRFPYGIYFRVVGDDVRVLAVMHGRRLPRRWRSRR